MKSIIRTVSTYSECGIRLRFQCDTWFGIVYTRQARISTYTFQCLTRIAIDTGFVLQSFCYNIQFVSPFVRVHLAVHWQSI